MRLEPFLIADMRTGKQMDRQPWLLPKDAFQTLTNCHFRRGVLEKRRGYAQFGRVVHTNTATDADTNPGNAIMGIVNHYSGSSETLLVFDTERGNTYNTTSEVFEDITRKMIHYKPGALLAFTSGGTTEILVGDTITGLTGGATAIVEYINLRSGTWAGGNAAGDLYLRSQSGTFESENISKGGVGGSDDATIASDSTMTAISADDWITDNTSGAIGQAEAAAIIDHGTNAAKTADGTIPFKNTTVSGTFATLNSLIKSSIPYDTGSAEPAVGEIMTGGTSSATAYIAKVTLDSGTWVGGDAAGTLYLYTITGTFQAEAVTTATGVFNVTEDATTTVVATSDGAAYDSELSGSATDFIVDENWDGITYITNGVDAIQKFNGTYLTPLVIDLDVEGGPDNDVTCQFIIQYRNRLLILNTTEKGTNYGQRCRWCDIQDPKTWPANNYTDADTGDTIVAADFLGSDLIIWFDRSVWRLEYTGNETSPFRWERIDMTEGCYAKMSVIDLSNEHICVGPTRIVGTDGREVYTLDDRIPDEMLSWEQNSVEVCFGVYVDEMQQAWITYVSQSGTEDSADEILVLNTEDNCYSNYILDSHVYGYYTRSEALTMDDISDAWDDLAIAWDQSELRSGYPITLMGDRSGYVYQMNYGDNDNGSDIEFNAKSGRWNPYIQSGKKAFLSHIDFLVDFGASTSFDVELFVNTESSSYRTASVTCTQTGTSRTKVWKRVSVSTVGDFHCINITNTASGNRPVIHAIVPYFSPVGGIING